MASCCGAQRCSCRVTAGPGVTVDGNGSAANPYVVSAGSGAPTPVQAGDTPTVDTTVTGTGTAGDPWVVSSAVVLDPAPPGGGTQLLQAGPDGLYLECEQVRGCFSAGDGASYDPATGEISARVSTDAGNAVSIGTDGGLYAPPAAGGTALQAGDTSTVDTSVTGTGAAGDPYVVSSAVILDPTPPQGGANLLQAGSEGLFLECADVRTCFSAGDGAAYDPATGEISARVSTDAGNTTSIGTDGGLFTPAPAPTGLTVTDTPSVDLTLTGTGAPGDPYGVTAAVRLDPTPPAGGANLIGSGPEGLFLECANVRGCITAGDGAAYTPATGEVEARLSADAGNAVAFGTDGGLFVPPPEPPEVGCGLQGDGTAGAPLAAFPIAGQEAWTADWDCDPVVNSTLKCDPTSGALWTPPEHTSAFVSQSQNHPFNPPNPAFGVTGWTLVDANAWSQGEHIADSFTPCRGTTLGLTFTGHVELTWTANAVFEVGYAVDVDGAGLAVRIMHSKLTAAPAGHERWSFSVHQALIMPPHTGGFVRVYPAIRVVAGTVTVNQWITDTLYLLSTR